MDAEGLRAIDVLADYVFAQNDPDPVAMEGCREDLPDGYQSLAALLLNIRLAVRWQGFDVSHGSVKLEQGPSAEAVTVKIRIYDPANIQSYIERALSRVGFMSFSFKDEYGGMGGWLFATAPPQLVERLQG